MKQTRARATLILFALACVLCLAAVALTAVTPGEGADIGAGGLILLAMLVGLVATVRTVQQQVVQGQGPGLDRPMLIAVAAGSAAAAALAAAVGQWPLAVAALIPAVVCAFFASGHRTT